MTDFEFTAYQAALVPVVMGIVQVFKITNLLPARFAPLLALILGVGGVFLLKPDSVQTGVLIIQGAMVGLSAAGLFSGVKTVAQQPATTNS